MSFQLSSGVDKNKIFLVGYSELQGRLDPRFYHLVKHEFRFRYPLAKTKYFFSIRDGDHSKFPSEESSNATTGIRYLRAQDLKEGEIISENPVYVSKKYFNTIKRSHIYPGYILFSIMASIGNMLVVPEDYPVCTANRAVGILAPKTTEINSLYFTTIFQTNTGEKLLEIQKRGGLQQRVNLEDIGELKIPVPTIQVQNFIAEYWQTAISRKKQKDSETQKLLDSIDSYLLGELGIELSKPEENSIQNRVFFCDSRRIAGRRFDPLYHSGSIYKFIESSIYDFKHISQVTTYMKTGFASGKQDQSNDDQDIIQIRSTNISDGREFIFARNVYIRKSELLNRKDDVLQFGEVLFNNTNSQELVGKSIFFDLDNPYFCSNHTTRIGVHHDKLDPQYLTHILNLYQRNQVFFKVCTNWNNQSGVNVNVLGQIKIPIPPLEKQYEIVDLITTIRNRVKQLRQEAEADLEQAKQEVESMILGEHENRE
jgi:restriction endonuclease S subunit